MESKDLLADAAAVNPWLCGGALSLEGEQPGQGGARNAKKSGWRSLKQPKRKVIWSTSRRILRRLREMTGRGMRDREMQDRGMRDRGSIRVSRSFGPVGWKPNWSEYHWRQSRKRRECWEAERDSKSRSNPCFCRRGRWRACSYQRRACGYR